MRKFVYVIAFTAAVAAAGGCSKNGQSSGDEPTRNLSSEEQGAEGDTTRKRTAEVTPDKQRPYANDNATEQTTTAPPDPEPDR